MRQRATPSGVYDSGTRTQEEHEIMILTTTHVIEGQQITRYCGIVTGEAILGANLFRDFFAGVRDIVGGGPRRMNASSARLARSR